MKFCDIWVYEQYTNRTGKADLPFPVCVKMCKTFTTLAVVYLNWISAVFYIY